MTRPRVLVVDDSAFARTVLSRTLRASGQVDVVGTARDGVHALARITELDPDVITLDLTMPELDGIGVLRALAGRRRPRVIVVSISSIETELGAEALALGAVALVAKPTALANDRLLEIGDELVTTTVAAAGLSKFIQPPEAPPEASPVLVPELVPGAAVRPRYHDLVVVGTSTGGPQALSRLVAGLPATFQTPLAMVLHIPIGFTEALAARLDKLTPLRVVEASDGLVMAPGVLVLARAGCHLRIHREGDTLRAEVATSPPRTFMPSVDELFISAAEAVGPRCLGVVMTGMGDDGLAGSRKIAAAGGELLVEAESTCVVYGMPRSVAEAGLGARTVTLDRMAHEISHRG